MAKSCDSPLNLCLYICYVSSIWRLMGSILWEIGRTVGEGLPEGDCIVGRKSCSSRHYIGAGLYWSGGMPGSMFRWVMYVLVVLFVGT